MSIHELLWVEQTTTVDAIDSTVVAALDNNPGWRLLGVGVGSGGQTTLTYGWPWPAPAAEPVADTPRVVDLMEALEASLAAARATVQRNDDRHVPDLQHGSNACARGAVYSDDSVHVVGRQP